MNFLFVAIQKVYAARSLAALCLPYHCAHVTDFGQNTCPFFTHSGFFLSESEGGRAGFLEFTGKTRYNTTLHEHYLRKRGTESRGKRLYHLWIDR